MGVGEWVVSSANWFKYTEKIHCADIGFSGNMEGDHKYNTKPNSRCNNLNICESRDNPFFIDPHIDRKGKLKNHHNSIDKIFKDWSTLRVCCKIEKGDLYRTSIPLYLDTADEIQGLDPYLEATSHISSGYNEIYKILKQIIVLQTNHNKEVSGFTIRCYSTLKHVNEFCIRATYFSYCSKSLIFF
jgi:hypothetical protein